MQQALDESPDMVGDRTIATLNGGKLSTTHSERSRGLDLMVSILLLAPPVVAIGFDNATSDEIGGASADRQSYFAPSIAANLSISTISPTSL